MDNSSPNSAPPEKKPLDKGLVYKRIFAGGIDAVFIPTFISFVISLFFVLGSARVGRFVIFFIVILWFTFKDLLFEGAGPGKKMLGLRVVQQESERKITAGQGFIRNVLLFLPIVAFIGFPLELIMLLLKGRRFGDKWAATKVIRSG